MVNALPNLSIFPPWRRAVWIQIPIQPGRRCTANYLIGAVGVYIIRVLVGSSNVGMQHCWLANVTTCWGPLSSFWKITLEICLNLPRKLCNHWNKRTCSQLKGAYYSFTDCSETDCEAEGNNPTSRLTVGVASSHGVRRAETLQSTRFASGRLCRHSPGRSSTNDCHHGPLRISTRR